MTETRWFTPSPARRIAYRHLPGTGPTLVFLPGYMSDMSGSKATALLDWARAQGRACLLLDYSGCGESEGLFAEQTLSGWTRDVIDLVRGVVEGPVVLVGSSMGGWVMLLAALAMPGRVHALVGIAAAPDFTAWGYSDEQQADLLAGETVLEENAYGPQPTPTFPGFWADAQDQLLLDGEIAIDAPVRLIQGQEDSDVPWELSLRLATALRSADVQVTLIKDGDHRLSRDGDIALLLRIIAALP